MKFVDNDSRPCWAPAVADVRIVMAKGFTLPVRSEFGGPRMLLAVVK